MDIADIFARLAPLPKWVPFKLVYDPKREKFDKVPHNGRHGLSTKEPESWVDLIKAIETSKAGILSGVGIVITGGIERDGWRLVGFDFDDVDFANFVLPVSSYAEKSPSGKGVRSFAWLPAEWVEGLKDATGIKYPNCGHAEIYIGSAPRFLTVTFDALNQKPIAELDPKVMEPFEEWLKAPPTPAPQPAPPLKSTELAGTPVYLPGFNLTDNERLLIEGKGTINRSDVLHGLVIKLIDGGAPQEDVLATISATPPLWQFCLDHRRNNTLRALQFARQEVARGYEKSDRAKRDRLTGFSQAWKLPDLVPKSAPADLPEPYAFPMELFDNAPGLLGEVAHWILRASFAPREEFAYASALSAISCLIGPYCTQGTREGKLNLYLTLVGDTGTGKNEAIDTMAILLAATEGRDCILDFPASEAALRRQLNLTPNVLLRVDELAHKLDSMKNNTNGSSLGRAVLEAYNGARMPPKVYADEKKTLPAVENPYVQILGGTTDKVWDVVKTSHMEDGTLNRFLFVCLPENPPYRRNLSPNSKISKELKDKLNLFWRDGKRYDLLGVRPAAEDGEETKVDLGRHIVFGPGVEKAVDELDKAAWEKQSGEYGSLYSRIVQNTLKIAGILAVSDGRLVITMDDFNSSKKFVEWSINGTHYKIVSRMADTHFERQIKRLMSKLTQCRGKLAVREAYKFMHISRREMEELTATLVLSGDVEIYEDPDSKREWLILTEKED